MHIGIHGVDEERNPAKCDSHGKEPAGQPIFRFHCFLILKIKIHKLGFAGEGNEAPDEGDDSENECPNR